MGEDKYPIIVKNKRENSVKFWNFSWHFGKKNWRKLIFFAIVDFNDFLAYKFMFVQIFQDFI